MSRSKVPATTKQTKTLLDLPGIAITKRGSDNIAKNIRDRQRTSNSFKNSIRITFSEDLLTYFRNGEINEDEFRDLIRDAGLFAQAKLTFNFLVPTRGDDLFSLVECAINNIRSEIKEIRIILNPSLKAGAIAKLPDILSKNLIKLDFSYSGLRDIGASVLAKTLSENKDNLIALDVSNNSIGTDSAIELIEAVSGAKQIVELNLSGYRGLRNGIDAINGDDIKDAICKLMKETPSLKKINLSQIEFSNETRKQLSEELSQVNTAKDEENMTVVEKNTTRGEENTIGGEESTTRTSTLELLLTKNLVETRPLNVRRLEDPINLTR